MLAFPFPIQPHRLVCSIENPFANNQNFLSFQTLQSIADLRRQYRDILAELGYIPEGYKLGEGVGKVNMDVNSKDGRVVKAVIVAGLYPQVARISMPEKRFEETLGGTVEVECRPEGKGVLLLRLSFDHDYDYEGITG